MQVPIRRIDPIGAIGNYWAELHTPTEADIAAVSIENITFFKPVIIKQYDIVCRFYGRKDDIFWKN
jgi:hypothetical protein